MLTTALIKDPWYQVQTNFFTSAKDFSSSARGEFKGREGKTDRFTARHFCFSNSCLPTLNLPREEKNHHGGNIIFSHLSISQSFNDDVIIYHIDKSG